MRQEEVSHQHHQLGVPAAPAPRQVNRGGPHALQCLSSQAHSRLHLRRSLHSRHHTGPAQSQGWLGSRLAETLVLRLVMPSSPVRATGLTGVGQAQLPGEEASVPTLVKMRQWYLWPCP